MKSKQERYRERQAQKGAVRLEVWLPSHLADGFRKSARDALVNWMDSGGQESKKPGDCHKKQGDQE